MITSDIMKEIKQFQQSSVKNRQTAETSIIKNRTPNQMNQSNKNEQQSNNQTQNHIRYHERNQTISTIIR